MNLVEQLACQIPGFQEIIKIPGISVSTAAGSGDINRFEHPKQVQKLAGLNLKANSSGKHRGKTTISKRGRKREIKNSSSCTSIILTERKTR